MSGLKLCASDIDGLPTAAPPCKEGPGEAIVLAAAGRKAALADLHGDGVAKLRQRIST